jgi:hypothetical protein
MLSSSFLAKSWRRNLGDAYLGANTLKLSRFSLGDLIFGPFPFAWFVVAVSASSSSGKYGMSEFCMSAASCYEAATIKRKES